MENKNDVKILQLKEIVEAKKKQIGELKSKNHSYKTKLVFSFDGNSYNLNVCGQEALEFILLKLLIYKKEAEALNFNLTIEATPIEDYITDIKTKLRIRDIKQKESQLKTMEIELDKKLSADTKNKIDLDNFDDILSKFNI